jgi:chloramphenicol O-acetyltransferase type A
MCANVDLTTFYPAVQRRGLSLTVALTFVLARAANAIPPFRYRIRSGEVIEHAVVHPSITVLVDDDLFSYCTFDYTEDFSTFAARAAQQIAHVKAHPTLEDEPGQDDLLFMTAIPWVTFTSFMHALPSHPADSTPRLAWGKFFKTGAARKMPLNVQVHHALVDGLHVGRFYAHVQDDLDAPERVLDTAQIQ